MLTVGQVREAMAGLPNDAPVRLAVQWWLPFEREVDVVLLATGEQQVVYLVEGGTVGIDSGVRTRIAWHVGNAADDVTGCIAFGQRLGTVSGKWAVQRSQDAMALLRDKLPNVFDFEIKWGMAV